jgi:Flp pilus assembly protein CpaB
MRRGRLLLLVGLIVALGAAVAVAVLLSGQQAETPPAPEAKFAEAEPTGVPTQKVWVALQPIPRGGEFVEGTLGLRDWPTSNVPPDAIGDMAETIGRVAATDITQGMPILRTMLAEKGAAGQAALVIPDGKVAVAFPIDEQSSVAYAVQAGDYVDVLILASFVDMDEDFRTKLPNFIQFFTSYTDPDTQETSFTLLSRTDEGKFERPPGLPPEIGGAIVYPREAQRPWRVAQLTVPGAKVLRVGPWIEQPQAQVPEGEEPPPAPLPTIMTLAVDPQDALVLLWARKSEMYMELALRAPGSENNRYQPEAVNLQYILTRFNIPVPPPKLEYGLEREFSLSAPVPMATPESMPEQ